METLNQNLQRTIRALESLSEKPMVEVEQVEELLDQLFQQKIDLVNYQINPASSLLQQTTQALGLAATHTEEAVRQPAHVAHALPFVHEAIEKLGKLLNGSLA